MSVILDASSPEHPYTAAFDDNGTVYVSGALSVDTEGNPVGGRRESLNAAVETLRRRLGTVGLGLEHVVKAKNHVTDVTLRLEANELFIDSFSVRHPARTFVGVTALPDGSMVEIDTIARRPEPQAEETRASTCPTKVTPIARNHKKSKTCASTRCSGSSVWAATRPRGRCCTATGT